MGYYSSVGIKCGNKAFEEFKKAYTEVNLLPDKVYENKYNEKLIVWENVKWYSQLPDVQAIEGVMDKLNEDDFFDSIEDDPYSGWGYKFIRFGECDDDVAERDNGFDVEFYYERSFNTDGMEPLNNEYDKAVKDTVETNDIVKSGYRIEKVYDLCVRKRYFTCGDNEQYERMFDMIRNGICIHDIATVIWICSDSHDFESITKIEQELTEIWHKGE